MFITFSNVSSLYFLSISGVQFSLDTAGELKRRQGGYKIKGGAKRSTQEEQMSLSYEEPQAVPEETARVARAAFPKGNVYMWMRDEVGILYTDATFVDLFAKVGQPGVAPWRLALILVMQFLEGLSDRQAAEMVRGRIDWKYALSLELTDPGFDASVLCEFRARLVEGAAEHQLLDQLLERFKTKGWLKARGKQRTDATNVLAAIRWVSRLVCVGETMRHALNRLAIDAPDWLRLQLLPEWKERYGHRLDEGRLPKDKTERESLAAVIGQDGFRLLSAAYAEETPAEVRQHPTIEILRQVWVQQYYGPTEPVRWRSSDDLPPAALMINSPYDVGARCGAKQNSAWLGYKVHLTEICDEQAPHLITNVETTDATVNDCLLPPTIHAHLAERGLLPGEHFLDGGYMESALILSSRKTYGVELVGPVSPDPSWQAKAGEGFDLACFCVDWDQHRVTCPQGNRSIKWNQTHDRHHNPIINVTFSAPACRVCPQHARCTTSAGARHITIRPKEQHEELQAARQRQKSSDFKEKYAVRAGIEGTFTQAIRVTDLRRSRYIGQAKTHLHHLLSAAALNLRRIFAWFSGDPVAQTRIAPFVALFPAPS
jgi:transposase